MIKTPSGYPLPLIDFRIGDYLYTPDVGSVNVTLTDHEGSVKHTASVPFDADYGIPQGLITVSRPQTLGFFKLVVSFQAEGRTRVYSEVVRVHEDYIYHYQPKDVRSLLGLFEEELPDDEVDLPLAYSELGDELGDNFYNDTEARKNKLVLLHEAMRQLPSLGMKTLKSTELDDTKKSRLSTVNVQAVQVKIEGQYFGLKTTFEGSEQVTESAILEFVSVSDPFTGEDAS